MERDKICASLVVYLSGTKRIRERTFREDLSPVLEDIINGVFLTLKLRQMQRADREDLKQEIYLKLLTRIQEKTPAKLKGIRSLKNSLFISVKNIAIDYLRSKNRLRDFDIEIKDCLTLYKIDEKI